MEQPYTITYNGKLTFVTVQGVVTELLLKQITEELWQGKDYQNPCTLWDFRTCIADLTPQDIKALSAFSAGNKGERGYGRIAIVVGHQLHLQLSRIYEKYTRSFPFEVKSFCDFDTAQDWLQEIE
jgi:hypothetical protein